MGFRELPGDHLEVLGGWYIQREHGSAMPLSHTLLYVPLPLCPL